MSLKNESVTILGAGIGGLTAAICLLQRGARVTIFDQAKKIEGFGAGIQLSPNGFGVMSSLGLASELISKGNILEFINVQNFKDSTFSSRVTKRPIGPFCVMFPLHLTSARTCIE